MKLLHLANSLSTNIGNGALILGTERVLDEDLGPIEWLREPWDDYTFERRKFDDTFVEKVNATDGLLVGAAVAINGRPYLANGGMRLDLPPPLWAKVRKPIIVYGISYRHWPGQPFHHLEKLRETVRVLLDRPDCFFSVRNDGTKQWLEELLGISDERIREVPDPAIYVPKSQVEAAELEPGRPNIIFAPNGEDSDLRFGSRGNASEYRQRILGAVARVLTSVVERTNANIILVPHYLDDYGMISELWPMLPPRIAHQNTVSTGLRRIGSTEEFYGLYAGADVAISMRVHSMSPSIGLGVPMVPLVTQDRMRAFLSRASLEDFVVDAFSDDLEEQLLSLTLGCLEKPDFVRGHFKRTMTRFREESRESHQQIRKTLGV
ncbi:MAG: polysaccharide pyruvyl transferase family protein [Alphaproteobacteria bacterium]